MNKTIIIILIIAVIILGGYFFLKGSQPSPANAPIVPVTNEIPTPLVSEQPSESSTPQPLIGQIPIIEEKIVTYSDAGFSPATLQVKAGETIIFKNQSSQSMWTASAAHPTHRIYPTTGGCFDSTFDACASIQPGDNWSFRFDIAGAWKYHNHLNPGDTGTIVVE